MPFVLTRQNLTPGMYHDSLAECKAVVISVRVKFTVRAVRTNQRRQTMPVPDTGLSLVVRRRR